MKFWSSLSFNDPNSPTMIKMMEFHDFSMMIMIFIMSIIIYMTFFNYINKYINNKINHNHIIEILWTIFPMIILLMMALPSLKILYLTDEIYLPKLTIKTIGHQWYWSYEYSDFNNLNFDSFMLNKMNKNNYFMRLLDVDNRLIIPNKIYTRLMTNSNDVIHSWTIPSLALKMDAIPGRLNQMLINPLYLGLYYGQCSEICGINHSFMPIIMEITSIKNFNNWIMKLI
uniref:Cytochrome c oxidase subunit 2 n=1 Tax=Cephalonomia gallicola TaxID=627714 RepID=E0WCE4_9HYME|nr:cytochrome c oxidase subunit II [Cephalonomia gallicola]